jgi:tRNA(Ile)-lysidine synthase
LTALLDEKALDALRGKKNLLAFSAGVDSTALFFLLRDADVNFDIALVNYNTRANSDAEEEYAKELAAKYGKECFTLSVKLEKMILKMKLEKVDMLFLKRLSKSTATKIL